MDVNVRAILSFLSLNRHMHACSGCSDLCRKTHAAGTGGKLDARSVPKGSRLEADAQENIQEKMYRNPVMVLHSVGQRQARLLLDHMVWVNA